MRNSLGQKPYVYVNVKFEGVFSPQPDLSQRQCEGDWTKI
jgi:hypothetical protein